jgi:hypothetical protein
MDEGLGMGTWDWEIPFTPPLEKGENKRGICSSRAKLCNDKQSLRFAATNRIGKAIFATQIK